MRGFVSLCSILRLKDTSKWLKVRVKEYQGIGYMLNAQGSIEYNIT